MRIDIIVNNDGAISKEQFTLSDVQAAKFLIALRHSTDEASGTWDPANWCMCELQDCIDTATKHQSH